MSVLFTRRGAAPGSGGSGGGGSETETHTVTVTGSGEYTYCYASINGEIYTSADTIEVAHGTEVTCFIRYAYGSTSALSATIRHDGTTVASLSSDGVDRYTFAVESDVSIALSIRFDTIGQITITTL